MTAGPEPLRAHVLVLDRLGYGSYHRHGTPFIDPARYEVSVVTKPGLVATYPAGSVTRVVAVERLTDEAALAEVVERLHRMRPLWRIVAVSEPQQLIAARMRQRFGLAGASYPQALAFRDKVVMKERLRAAGVDIPDFEPLESAAQAAAFTARYGAAVIKPCLGTASQRTHVVRGPVPAARIADEVLSSPQQYEIEAYIDATLYHCDGLRVGGCTTVRSVSRYWQPTLGFTTEHRLASSMVPTSPLTAAVDNLNERVLDALELTRGVTHLEVFAPPAGPPIFCEVAARAGGAGVVPAVEVVHGINLIECAIRLELDEPVPDPVDRANAAGWVVFHRKPGQVRDISTQADFPESWVEVAQVNVSVGDVSPAARTSVDAAALLIVSGDTHAEVERRLHEVVRRFRYETVAG